MASGFWARGRADKHRLGLLRQNTFALLHELGARAHVESAFRTVKIVLFELVPHLGLELVE
jgi:hypothetical protein